jgi:hypothetical protein
VALFDNIVDQSGLVVKNFNRAFVQHKFILEDLKPVTWARLTLASTSRVVRIAVQWQKASLLPLMVGLHDRP